MVIYVGFQRSSRLSSDAVRGQCLATYLFLKPSIKRCQDPLQHLGEICFDPNINRPIKPTFLSHPITVLTDSILDRVLTNPEAIRRLIKWTTKLDEYDVQYQPRAAIKAQALADFLIETSSPELLET